jgi:hypothetical protein
MGEMEARFGPFEDIVNLGTRCIVCAECTSIMKTISGAPNG